MKGLETLKTIRHIHDMECGKDQAMDNAFDIVEKELRSLEIIKNSGLNMFHIDLIRACKTYKEYEKQFLFTMAIGKRRDDAFKFEIMRNEDDFNVLKETL